MSRTAFSSVRPIRRGFTLVEILIVVIILGILAAIVIPQFTSASEDARKNSASSLLQTIRAQIELYKLQHGDRWPTSTGTTAGTFDWTGLTGTTTFGGNSFGPYLQQTPVNPFNNRSNIGTTPAATVGFVFDANGKFYCVDGSGAAYGN